MKKRLFVLGVFITLIFGISAQNKGKRNVQEPTYTVAHCMENYMFEEAEKLLEKNIVALKRKKEPTDLEEYELKIAEKGKKMIHATQKITFIDSMVVDRTNFLESFKLGREAGSIDTYDNFFKTNENFDGMVYITERGNKCYFSRPTISGGLELYTSDLIAGKWSTPTPLNGLGDAPVKNYPFMCADGITLYYAAEGEESLGGYDIYVTRYNSSTQQFVRAENIGMPFNSPANDYLYAIDEINNLGWFVTDRNQPEDKVCIYIFTPSEMREIYNYLPQNRESVARAARIYSIAETWSDRAQVEEAKVRLRNSMNVKQIQQTSTAAFDFVINDQNTYTQLSNFRSEESKNLLTTWLKGTTELKEMTQELETLRERYRTSNTDVRREITQKILSLEKMQQNLQRNLHEQTKKIRSTELKQQ